MLFNSDIFLFLFLPATLLTFYALGKSGYIRLAILSLVVASLIYYAWWNPAYLPLIFGSMFVNYFMGVGLQKMYRADHPRIKLLLTLGVGFNIALLGYFKYANFFADNISALTGEQFSLAPIILPLAISFFTFQQIAYLVDVYQGKASEVDLLRYALFVTFFPQLIAGPIVHHSEMMPQFADKKIGRFQLGNLIVGNAIFFIGLFKKLVFADNVAPYASAVFDGVSNGATVGFADAWVGSLAYSCQIYFDFSGYSDMAIGLALMFGINLPLNFNSPYQATGIIDFWRRWHMTLSRFLRDYLYIPLGGNRLGAQRRYINMMSVMLLGGLWHGAGWGFVVWGGLHGLYLGVNHAWRGWRGGAKSSSLFAVLLSRALTFLAVTFAWVFFRAENLDAAMAIISAMAGLGVPDADGLKLGVSLVDAQAFIWIACLLSIAWFAPNTQQFMRKQMDRQYYNIGEPLNVFRQLFWQPSIASAALIAFVTAITIISLWQPSEFIYYQF
jgi:alginate O-acetyltransferase complex protein AlgI